VLRPLGKILCYTEYHNWYDHPEERRLVPIFVSPADPSLNDRGLWHTISSYVSNAELFRQPGTIANLVRDGSSNTIMYAERYAVCRSLYNDSVAGDLGAPIAIGYLFRRATFADQDYVPHTATFVEAVPVTSGNPPVSRSSRPGLTFQVAPTLEECDPGLAQTPHPGGMLVGMADGSVRTLSGRISETTYWALVTPRGREALGSDW
jgi:hypothetical protein